MKNLICRTLTGIVYVAVIVAAILFGTLSFAAVFAVFTGLLVGECLRLIQYKGSIWGKISGIAGGMYFFVATALFKGDYVGKIIFLPYIMLLLIIIVSTLYYKKGNPLDQLGKYLFVQIYCVGGLSALNGVSYSLTPEYSPLPVLMLFIFIWLNDTGAFIIGSWLGKRRLFQSISPKKSWEGFFGGCFITVSAAVAMSFYIPDYNMIEWIIFAIITVIAATFGDLFESLVKRTFHAKDSGNILPGHGGFLDRFDSVILAAPTVYVLFEIFGF
ncbi:MAG: phosphatidate cytidylyltransferase [Tannerella sp.]|jgi:phosphatidate cytidylyltransferase|nr:phosphatidate cytidylyltransferase [Tannerella sp.]